MASWFIARASAGSGFADHLANLLGLATAASGHAAGAPAGFTVGLAGTVTTAFIAIVLGIIAFLAAVIQIMLMLVRGGMLVLLVGTLPLVAAFSNTEMGLQWFRKASAWLIAFALYKPAAAVVYAVAFDLAGQQGALALLDGVMMLVLAILALPALLRFVVPATSALAGAGGCGSDARRGGGRRDRDADADRRGAGRADAGERLRPIAERQRPLRRGARGRRGSRRSVRHERQWPGGHRRPRRPRRRVRQPGGCRPILGRGVRRRGRAERLLAAEAPRQPVPAAAAARAAGAGGGSGAAGAGAAAAGAVVQAYGAGKQAARGAVEQSKQMRMVAMGRPRRARPATPTRRRRRWRQRPRSSVRMGTGGGRGRRVCGISG